MICATHNSEMVLWGAGNGTKRFRCKECSREKSLRHYIKDQRGAMLTAARKRAKAQGVPCTITKEDIVIPTHCPVLGIELRQGRSMSPWTNPNSPSLDRFKPELGYIPSNVMVISWRANKLKCDATPDELTRIAAYAAGPRP